ncbi:Hypp6532 [Branchiostoma lanceolatum]|uniref:Hypp6532 protein n=1 Tax=Branchiostoma lanceolatum TaxID=7740 RepID=A0A8K0EAW1_BRALA|nr:Hypp6532 [Branchiostoma lanceolatum]
MEETCLDSAVPDGLEEIEVDPDEGSRTWMSSDPPPTEARSSPSTGTKRAAFKTEQNPAAAAVKTEGRGAEVHGEKV